MKIAKVIASFIVAVMAFFSGTIATKLLVAYEIGSYPPDVKEWYSFCDKETQVPFLTSYKKGKAEAQADIEQGKLKLKVTGWGADPEVEKKRFTNIYQKYEIEMERIADCMISHGIIGYQKGYNQVMKSAIHQRYGAGFLERMSSEEN